MASTLPAGRMDVRRLIAIFLIASAGVTFFLAFAWGKEVLTAHQAATWPTVQGTVTVSKTDTCKKHGDLRPHVRYTYVVAGQLYKGYRIAFWPDSCTSEARAVGVAALYPIGSVSVWFDPQHPETAALMVGDVLHETWSSLYGAAAVCVASLLLAAWCLRSAVRAEQRWKAQGL